MVRVRTTGVCPVVGEGYLGGGALLEEETGTSVEEKNGKSTVGILVCVQVGFSLLNWTEVLVSFGDFD